MNTTGRKFIITSYIGVGLLILATIISLVNFHAALANFWQELQKGFQFLTEAQGGQAFAYIVLMLGFMLAFVFYYFYAREQHALNQEKDLFMSLASHQLRTPLGAIRWNLEGLLSGEEGQIDPGAQTVLREIYQSNQHLIGLVNNLLEISRINQGVKKFTFHRQDPQSVIAQAIEEIQPLAKQKNITIIVEPAAATPPFMLEDKHFREVVTNLLSNAVKYNRTDGQITVSTQTVGPNWQIAVADTGVGIPAADQGSLFSKFYRASNAMTGNTEGEGIGLYMVKMFVQSWGGRVWFESAEGQGSTFHILLPMKK